MTTNPQIDGTGQVDSPEAADLQVTALRRSWIAVTTALLALLAEHEPEELIVDGTDRYVTCAGCPDELYPCGVRRLVADALNHALGARLS